MLQDFGIDLDDFNSIIISKKHKEIRFVPAMGKSVTLDYDRLTNHSDLKEIVVECENVTITIDYENKYVTLDPTDTSSDVNSIEYKYKTLTNFKTDDSMVISLI